jgi:alkanesulfonate monooxygenase SsuD/methylene tetrahydromethanopterin reductase-like flavin-dependent oxidoreductase (luciferase family)
MTSMIRRDSRLFGPNRLRLGIFAANCSGGLAATTVPERWASTWDDNEAIAKLADAAGIEFMLPIARWRGYGGTSDYHRTTFETITWACGLLAATKSLTVFGTVHAPLIHPILAAKQFVTVDHIGRGRFGLNIVCGWNEDEFEMFGERQREHDTRYVFGQEWLDVVQRIWTCSDVFDLQPEGRDRRSQAIRQQPAGTDECRRVGRRARVRREELRFPLHHPG